MESITGDGRKAVRQLLRFCRTRPAGPGDLATRLNNKCSAFSRVGSVSWRRDTALAKAESKRVGEAGLDAVRGYTSTDRRSHT